tara:strand:- start:318 stop:428 length:111 start_codon:yes stop_codon:yes gene_type:complete
MDPGILQALKENIRRYAHEDKTELSEVMLILDYEKT